jgi:hypothetical protein
LKIDFGQHLVFQIHAESLRSCNFRDIFVPGLDICS